MKKYHKNQSSPNLPHTKKQNTEPSRNQHQPMAPLWVLTKHTYLPGVAYELSWTTLEVTEVDHSKVRGLKSQIARSSKPNYFPNSKIHLSLLERWQAIKSPDFFLIPMVLFRKLTKNSMDPTLRSRRDPVGWLIEGICHRFLLGKFKPVSYFQLSNEKKTTDCLGYIGDYTAS